MAATAKAPKAPKAAATKDFFDVLFVGLFCFRKDARVAVMPDGREPEDDNIPPHVPFLVVDPKGVVASSGWDVNPDDLEDGIYRFGKCTIDITRATAPGELETTQHDVNVFKLVKADKSFQFADANARIITEILLGQGTLELFRHRGAEGGSSNAATLSRLRVRHAGDIFVIVAVEGEPQPRVLALKPGTDIAIANAILEPGSKKTGNPFALFGRIAKNGKITPPDLPSPNVPEIPKDYQVFKLGNPIGEGSGSSGSTGCCPPP